MRGVARELSVVAVVGCGDATKLIKNGQQITVSCAEGKDGNIYKDKLKWEVTEQDFSQLCRHRPNVHSRRS
jgi:pyruvate,water dikinase